MKYTNSEAWGIAKAQYRGMGYYNKAVENEPRITAFVVRKAELNGFDTAGMEFRIKTKESFLRKIESSYSASGNTYEIKDIIRYTYVAPPDELAEKTTVNIKSFSDDGYDTISVKNTWRSKTNPYKGINTSVKTSDGQVFELQYHTQESFDLKNGKLHELYEKSRLLDRRSEQYIALQDEMFKLSETLEIPKGIEKVVNK